jgi:SAM-dependent methyltransferase
MRRELVKNCPDVTVLAGSAEQLPLDSGSVGAVLLKGVWHWLDVPRATAEIARVLSPGGRLGVCWYAPTNPAGSGRHDLFPPEVLRVVTSVHRAGHEPRRFELLVPGLFGEPEKYEREHTLRMTPPQVGALLNTYSAMMHPDFADRHHELTEVTVAFARDQTERSGMSTVPVRFTATCYRVSRI